MMSGVWKYPPRKDHKAQQRREALIFALWVAGVSIFALLIGSWATKAISQAAYDARGAESTCYLTGC